MVVDDEPIVLDVTSRLLEEFGYIVITAGGGKAAIESYSQHSSNIDVVLLDMTMKDMTGGEVLDELVKIRRDVRVVLCSGYTEEDIAEKMQSKKRSDFLQKPFTAAALIEAIERSNAA